MTLPHNDINPTGCLCGDCIAARLRERIPRHSIMLTDLDYDFTYSARRMIRARRTELRGSTITFPRHEDHDDAGYADACEIND